MQGRLSSLIARRFLPPASRLSFFQIFTCSSESALRKNPTFHRDHRENPNPHRENPNPDPSPNPYLDTNLDPNSNLNPNPDSALLPAERTIWAVERLGKGRWFSNHDRKEARIPGYVYDQEKPDAEHVLIIMDKYQIRSLWSKLGQERFLLTIFNLEVYDGMGSRKVLHQQPVIPRRINFDKQGNVCNIGFLRAPPGMKLRLDSPIHVCGQENCVGLKKGGHLKLHLGYVTFLCLPNELPPHVEVNVDSLDIEDKIFLVDLKVEVPFHPKSDPSLMVCEIVRVPKK